MDKTFKESQGFFDLIIGPVTVCFFFHSYLTESKHTRQEEVISILYFKLSSTSISIKLSR